MTNISCVLFHLHTEINKKFWDQVNFVNGKNIPKEERLRPRVQFECAWTNFEEFVNHMQSFQDEKFVIASDAARICELDDEQLKSARSRSGSD